MEVVPYGSASLRATHGVRRHRAPLIRRDSVRRILLVLLGCLTSMAAAPLTAQSPARPAGAPPAAGVGEVRGVVIDSAANAPIPRASVTLRSKPSAALVTGAIATADGAFRLPGLRAGN